MSALKVKRAGTGWYYAKGERFDFELLNEDGWQLMVYRPGTFEIVRTPLGSEPYYSGAVAHGDCIYAVTLTTKRDAVDWANAFEDGTQKLEEFVSLDDLDSSDWIPTGYTGRNGS